MCWLAHLFVVHGLSHHVKVPDPVILPSKTHRPPALIDSSAPKFTSCLSPTPAGCIMKSCGRSTHVSRVLVVLSPLFLGTFSCFFMSPSEATYPSLCYLAKSNLRMGLEFVCRLVTLVVSFLQADPLGADTPSAEALHALRPMCCQLGRSLEAMAGRTCSLHHITHPCSCSFTR